MSSQANLFDCLGNNCDVGSPSETQSSGAEEDRGDMPSRGECLSGEPRNSA